MPAVPAPSFWIVTDLLMLRVPNPPPSITLISPPAMVAASAAANVAQGWLRLHGLASLPLDPATQVRGTCACADNEETANNAAATGAASTNFIMAHS